MQGKVQNMGDLAALMEQARNCHDTCITEMQYISGAYVNEKGMYPVNDRNEMRVVLMGLNRIELTFRGLRHCRWNPVDPDHTCEIHGASLWMGQDGIFWCNDDWVGPENWKDWDGILICAKELEWRITPPEWEKI